MEEREIIRYLKDNKTNGVAFMFMPSDVQKWCRDNLLDTVIPFRKMSRDGWIRLNYDEPFFSELVYCVEEYFNKISLFEPHWEEFSIDKEGFFHFEDTSFRWYDWTHFLTRFCDRYKTFGGLFYDPGWYMNPVVTDRDGHDLASYDDDDKDKIVGYLPTRIRFWRYKE